MAAGDAPHQAATPLERRRRSCCPLLLLRAADVRSVDDVIAFLFCILQGLSGCCGYKDGDRIWS